LKSLPILLLLFCFTTAVFLPGCCTSKKKKLGFASVSDRPSYEDGRTSSRMGDGSGKKNYGNFRGFQMENIDMEELKADGTRALKDEYFIEAMAALKKEDYSDAESNIRYALGNQPSNKYLKRYQKKIELGKQAKLADENDQLKSASRLFVETADPSSILTQVQGLDQSENPYVRKKAFYYKSQAYEMMNNEGEALANSLMWQAAREEISRLDAESTVFPVSDQD
jgi:hypothetical protein